MSVDSNGTASSGWRPKLPRWMGGRDVKVVGVAVLAALHSAPKSTARYVYRKKTVGSTHNEPCVRCTLDGSFRQKRETEQCK